MRVTSDQFKIKYKTLKKNRVEAIHNVIALIKNKKTDLTDYDKEDLKILRGILKSNNEKQVEVIHKKTGLSQSTLDLCEGDSKKRLKLIKKLAVNIRKSINDKRVKARKKSPNRTVEFFGAKRSSYGGVFLESGSMLNLLKNSDIHNPNKEKKPWTDKFNFIGIELEFNHNSSRDTEQKKIKDRIKSNNLGKFVNVTTDHCGHELRILVPEIGFEDKLKKIIDILVSMGFEGIENCGLHVHLDMRNRDVKKCYTNLYMIQNLANKLVKSNRVGGRYSRVNECEQFDEQCKIKDRYRYINVESYPKHQTLEVRLHHGTLNYKDISNWIKLLLKCVNNDKIINKKINKPIEVSKQLKFTAPELNHLRNVYNRYNKRGA